METKCEICREIHGPDRGLSFDGKGINSCSMYRSRLLTLTHPNEYPQLAAEIVRRYNAHAELVRACEAAVAYLDRNYPKGNIRDNFAAFNERENDVLKPLSSALGAAKG